MIGSWRSWRSQAQRFPDHPVTIRRRVLSIMTMLLFGGMTIGILSLATFPPNNPSDRLTDVDWYLPLGVGLKFGAAHRYLSCNLVVSKDKLVAHNLIFTEEVWLAEVKEVLPGWHLGLRGNFGVTRLWAIESTKIESVTENFESQGDVVQFISDCVRNAPEGTSASGRAVRTLRPPSPFLGLGLFLLISLSVALLVGWQPPAGR